jgi:hypothetical protein
MNRSKTSTSLLRSALIAISSVALTSGIASASQVLIDFGRDIGDDEFGFVEQTEASAPYSTDQGDITVASSGDFFDRSAGSAYTSALLYGDFTYEKNTATNALTITISGTGIVANTDYDLEFFSYDSLQGGGGGGGTVSYVGLSGAVGGTAIAYSNAFTDDNSSLSTFTSNGSGDIVIGVTGTNEDPRVSGMTN